MSHPFKVDDKLKNVITMLNGSIPLATMKIVITGTIDINKEDMYKLTYTVKDSDGNTSHIERLVVVEKDDEAVPPIEELESLLPHVIIEAITNNLVNINQY